MNGTVITVAGAKGGIGKSVLAVNLALALHQRSTRRVALVDADTSFGDLATMLDLTPEVILEKSTRLYRFQSLHRFASRYIRECFQSRSEFP